MWEGISRSPTTVPPVEVSLKIKIEYGWNNEEGERKEGKKAEGKKERK